MAKDIYMNIMVGHDMYVTNFGKSVEKMLMIVIECKVKTFR